MTITTTGTLTKAFHGDSGDPKTHFVSTLTRFNSNLHQK